MGGEGLLGLIVHHPRAGWREHGWEANEGVEDGGDVVVCEAPNAVEEIVPRGVLLWRGGGGRGGFVVGS